MSISVRYLNQDDAKIFKDLRLESFQSSPFAFSESYEDEVKRGLEEFEEEIVQYGEPLEQYTLGAFDEADNLIGFVRFRRDRRSKARHKSMVFAMYVTPNFRSKGVGKLLIENVLNHAKKLEGLEQVHLWVLHSNSTTASDFYKKCGFESQGIVKKDLKIEGQYIDSEYMVFYL